MLNHSLKLLGYSENNGNAHLTQVIKNRALPIINLVYAELARNCEQRFEPLKSLSETIMLPDKAINEVMPCGIAMYIANAEGDSAAEAFWGAEYNAKRATLSRIGEIKDVLPSIW